MTIDIPSIAELPQAAANLLAAVGTNRIVLFHGDMGAGKTTLISAICRQLGVADVPSSPTFSIVNEYSSPDGPVYHFDFYRLKSEQEAFDLGYEEYFYSGTYCFVEWPEKIPNLAPEDAVHVRIHVTADGGRQLTVNTPQ